MDDKGYAFTPLVFLLLVPVMVLAVSYNNVIDEINTISAIAVGGDVTITIAKNIVSTIQQDTGDAGRNAAFMAVEKVIDQTSIYYGNQPFFGTAGDNQTGNNSKAFIHNQTLIMLNSNITATCRELEKQTGRNITINGVPVDPNGTGPLNIFSSSNINIAQSDPFGFNITVSSVPIVVVQNNQSVRLNTPSRNVYVPIEKLEDPYVWVNTKERNSSVIYQYPYYTSQFNDYHFYDNVSPGKLNYLWECLNGVNASAMGPRSYYIPDPHGLSFFDRLENRTNDSSGSPASARMSTFILYDPLAEDHNNNPTSMLDHEYFAGVSGHVLTTTVNGTTANVLTPLGGVFLISNNYQNYFFNNKNNFP